MEREVENGKSYPIVLMFDTIRWKTRCKIPFEPHEIVFIFEHLAETTKEFNRSIHELGKAVNNFNESMDKIMINAAKSGKKLRKFVIKGMKKGKSIKQIQKEVLK